MKSNKKETRIETSNNSNTAQGFYAQPRAYLSQDGEYLTLVLPGHMIVRKHVNFYKSILGLPFVKKSSSAAAEIAATQEVS